MHARALFLGLALGCVGCLTTKPETDVVCRPQTYVEGGKMMAEAAGSKEFSEEQRQEQRTRARATFKKALEGDPKNVEAHIGLARLEIQVGNYSGAEEMFKKALVHAGRDAMLWAEVGQAQLKQKLWAAAAGSYAKAVEMEPVNRHYMSSLAACLMLSKQYNEAHQVLARLHGEAKACVEMARAMVKLNDPEQAGLLLVRAEQLAPGSPEVVQLRAELTGPRDAGVVQADYRPPVAPAPEIRSTPKEEPRMPKPPTLQIRAGR